MISLFFFLMTRTLNLTPFESSEFEVKSTFNVVIAYEELETGKHAKKIYDFLVENLGPDCRFTNQMWKFEVLGIPKLREMAARDAAAADIIMISCRGSELPPEVKAWIELWLAEQTHPIALVALFDQQHALTSETAEVRSYLAAVSKRGRMEFFAQPDHWPGNKQSEDAFRVRSQNDFPDGTIVPLAGAMQRDSFLHWGINE